jgi:outer membrane protein OmpA-like peptidoglycan-associated protein
MEAQPQRLSRPYEGRFHRLTLIATAAILVAAWLTAPATQASTCPAGMDPVAGQTDVCEKRFTAPGAFTFTMPSGVARVDLGIIGGGGGGGGGGSTADQGGGGGGAGQYSLFSDLPVSDVSGSVGAGGSGGTSGGTGSSGATGGDTTVVISTGTITVKGGTRGLGGGNVLGAQGGSSGVAISESPPRNNGGDPGLGVNIGGGGGGGDSGNGSANAGFSGGAGGSGSIRNSGLFPEFDSYAGGGGGGAGRDGNGNDGTGGVGGSGGGGSGGSGVTAGSPGVANTGGGGGGGGERSSGGRGGDGLVVVRIQLITLPGAPREVVARAGIAQAFVSWTAPPSDGGASITNYTVTSNPGNRTCTTTGALSCTVTNLSTGTPYTFTVSAANVAGTGPASVASNSVTPAAPPAPAPAPAPAPTPGPAPPPALTPVPSVSSSPSPISTIDALPMPVTQRATATVFFSPSSATLDASAKRALRTLIKGRAKSTVRTVSVGYAHSNNWRSANRQLAQQRATAVVQYMNSRGVTGVRITRVKSSSPNTRNTGRKAVVTVTYRN